jgi:NDP-sugar pyrophosphorylase family protein
MEKNTLVILAAGKGTRFLPLTNTVPKPLLKVAGKPVIAHQIEAAFPYINEVVIVVGYLKKKIIDFFGDSYHGIPINYVEQKEAVGSSDALKQAKDKIKSSKFFLIYGDDIYNTSFFKEIASIDYAAIGMRVENWRSYGIFHIKNGNYLDEIVEKPHEYVGDLANIGVFKVDISIFEYLEKISKSERGEYELTDVMTLYTKDHPMEIIEVSSGWQPLSYPWNLLEATKTVLNLENSDTIIIGTNSTVGNNCTLKGCVVIGNNCHIENDVEISHSIIGDNVKVNSFSSIYDSLLGNNIEVGKNTHIYSSNTDKSTVKVDINGKIIDTHRQYFGAIIGDNSKIAINTQIYPGKKLWNNSMTLPDEEVHTDKIAS